MASKVRRPTSSFPWKFHRSPTGFEHYHYPTSFACRTCLYPRAIGKAIQTPSFRMGHGGEDGYLLHWIKHGNLWHRFNERIFTASPSDACLLDLSRDVV